MDVRRTGGTPSHSVRAPRLQGAFGGALVALSAAAGLVVGLHSVAALGTAGVRSLLRLPQMPADGLGIVWSDRVVWPSVLQAEALDRLAAVVVGLFLAAVSVALLNALILLLEAGASRRREVAVRSAIGAPPGSLVLLFLNDVRRLVSLALVLGLLLGLSAGGALRSAWPGELAALGGLDAAGTVALGLLTVAGVAALAYVWVGLTLGRARGLSSELGAGERATEEPAAIFRRRALSALQMGTAGSVAVATLALARAVGGSAAATAAVATTVVPVTAPAAISDADGAAGLTARGAAWEKMLRGLSDVPGLQAESLATPGTLVGLGVRDYATAQCGKCMRSLLPAPLWGAVADHFAVAPGYFRLTGRRLVSGRALTAADGPSAKKVVLVNETFAYTAFEKGNPLGHLVHLGHTLDAWYEVVGVVADATPTAVGRDDIPRAEVYVSALQAPPARGEVLLRGTEDGVRRAVDVLAGAGYAPGSPRTLGAVRAAAAAPLVWIGRVALALALVTLLLALQGAHATALQVTRRRLRELAIRRVLGATNPRVLLFVFLGGARGALWGSALAVFLGSLWVGLLQKTAAGVPSPGPAAYLAMVLLLVGAAVLASMKAAREALAVTPAEAVA